jgi:DNA-binding CsgD family transcriptional regulator
MSGSNRLRLNDVEGVFTLVHQCREQWADAHAWREHLLSGACRLTGMAVGIFLEQHLSPDRKSVEFLDQFDCGWRDAGARAHYMRLFTDHPNLAQFLPGCTRLAGMACDGRDANALRPQISPDRLWYASRVFNDYHRPACVDGYVLSYAHNHDGDRLIMLCVCQDQADPAPTERARATLSLLNRQIAPLVGTLLATTAQLGWHGLSPRLRQTLEGLLSGESEKQIAARLGISRPTVHEYVGGIYRHFGVEGRGELAAYFLRRRPAPR